LLPSFNLKRFGGSRTGPRIARIKRIKHQPKIHTHCLGLHPWRQAANRLRRATRADRQQSAQRLTYEFGDGLAFVQDR
jgi:hypothetical protein